MKATGNSFAHRHFFVGDFFGFVLPCTGLSRGICRKVDFDILDHLDRKVRCSFERQSENRQLKANDVIQDCFNTMYDRKALYLDRVTGGKIQNEKNEKQILLF